MGLARGIGNRYPVVVYKSGERNADLGRRHSLPPSRLTCFDACRVARHSQNRHNLQPAHPVTAVPCFGTQSATVEGVHGWYLVGGSPKGPISSY